MLLLGVAVDGHTTAETVSAEREAVA